MEAIASNFEKPFDPGGRPASGTSRADKTTRILDAERGGPKKVEEARKEQQKSSEPAQNEGTPTSSVPNQAVTFRLSQESGRFYIQVVDRATGEVVRQIPSDQMLKLAESLQVATGNLLDTSA